MTDIRQIFPEITDVTEWYLSETIFCLQYYAQMEEETAYLTIVSNEHFQFLVERHPEAIQREDGFYWAMYLVYGQSWWKEGEHLIKQHGEYLNARHNPPMDDL